MGASLLSLDRKSIPDDAPNRFCMIPAHLRSYSIVNNDAQRHRSRGSKEAYRVDRATGEGSAQATYKNLGDSFSN